MTIEEIAQLLDAEIEGDSSSEIHGPAKIELGNEGEIGFYANPKYEKYLYETKCSAILVQRELQLKKKIRPTLLRVDNVYEAIGTLLGRFSPEASQVDGISHLSSIASSAQLLSGVKVGDFSIIGQNVTIGPNTTIYGQVFIGENCTIGPNCIIYPGVKIYHGCNIGANCVIHSNVVIGSDGFGFSKDEHGQYKKIPQAGNVEIKDDVEIGANTVIDRATMGSTVIHSGVKLDNLIQVGHNAQIGQDTVIAAQTGVSGSTQLGSRCMIGGQVGFVGHIQIADGSMIQAQSGVSKTIKEPNKKHYGYPAIGYQNYLKSYAYFKNLPEIIKKIESLEAELDILRNSKNKD